MLVPEACWSDDDDVRQPDAHRADAHRSDGRRRGGRARRPRRRLTKVVFGLVGAAILIGVGAGTTAWAAPQLFSDVGPDHPFFGEINWMSHHNISTGYDDGTFRPNDPVSRQAMSAFLRRLNFETSLVSVTIPMTSAAARAGTAMCPAGKSPISGGGQVDSLNQFMTDSYPNGSGWTVRWESANGAVVDSGGRVWVLCKPNNAQS